MLQNFKLTIEYDGSAFQGWQIQPYGRTVQNEIQVSLTKMTKQQVVLIGSGRTDSGVHALGQVANFQCDTKITAQEFQRGLNSLLPDDIVIKSCQRVDDNFHSRFDAISKIYRYQIIRSAIPIAIGRQYALHIKRKLNLDAMNMAVSHIIGTHDFKAFEGSGSPRSHSTRNVIKAGFIEKPPYLYFQIEADGFLRYMVRNIVGTLIDVGYGKIRADDFNMILTSKDRGLAGTKAPAHGLFLIKVNYN